MTAVSTAKHTPGPWRQRPSYHNGEPQGYVVQAGIRVIADLTCSPENLSVEESNARLIAAAPRLLEACRYVVKYHRENDSGEGELFGLDFVTACISAIREAEGTV